MYMIIVLVLKISGVPVQPQIHHIGVYDHKWFLRIHLVVVFMGIPFFPFFLAGQSITESGFFLNKNILFLCIN